MEIRVKDMLKAGLSPDELKAKLNAEIEAARVELEEECKTNSKKTLDQIRRDLVESALNYMDAMEWINAQEINQSDFEDYCATLESMEDELDMYATMLMAVVNKQKKRMEKKCGGSCSCKKEAGPKEKTIDERLDDLLKGLL